MDSSDTVLDDSDLCSNPGVDLLQYCDYLIQTEEAQSYPIGELLCTCNYAGLIPHGVPGDSLSGTLLVLDYDLPIRIDAQVSAGVPASLDQL